MEKYIEFPPIIHEKWIKYLNYNDMNRLLQGFSSPLNIMNLDILEENIEKFKKFYEEKGLTGKIQFAQKSTKSEAAIRKALKTKINMDVAIIALIILLPFFTIIAKRSIGKSTTNLSCVKQTKK